MHWGNMLICGAGMFIVEATAVNDKAGITLQYPIIDKIAMGDHLKTVFVFL
jgi:hypothetical protein